MKPVDCYWATRKDKDQTLLIDTFNDYYKKFLGYDNSLLKDSKHAYGRIYIYQNGIMNRHGTWMPFGEAFLLKYGIMTDQTFIFKNF